jgi:hypothetical protein
MAWNLSLNIRLNTKKKNMKKFTLSIGVLILLTCSGIYAQGLEKTHEISAKSKKGNITNMVYDPDTGEIELNYMYNTTINGEAVYETFKYDAQFEQIDNSLKKGQITDLSEEVGNSNYKGESYSIDGVKLGYNISAKMEMAVISTKTTFNYNWAINDYEISTEEVSRKGLIPDDAAGYIGYLGVEDLHNGGGLFVATLRDKMFGKGVDRYKQYKKLRFIKMDKNMTVTNESKLDLEQMHDVVFQKVIYEKSDIASMPKLKGVALVLAPVFLKKVTTKPADEWVFLFIDTDGNISKNVDFKVPSSKWDISDIVYNESSDELYVYGPANKSVNKKGVMKYYKNLTMQSTSTTSIGGEKKYSMLQIMKVKENDVAYVTNESLDEMADKTYNLKGVSKKRIYKARKFETMGVNYMSNGDFMLYGTNYGSKDSLGVKSNYNEAVTIHFDKDGGVKKIYAIKPYENNYQNVPMTNTIINDQSGKYMYWMLEENAGIKSSLTTQGSSTKSSGSYSYSGSFVWKYKYLLYPRIIKIDLEKATMEEFIPGNKTYFLDNKYPFVQTSDGNFIFFGADKKGKNIWFNKLEVN